MPQKMTPEVEVLGSLYPQICLLRKVNSGANVVFSRFL